MQSLTPVLYVEAIEPVLPFWIERLGFEKQFDVPEDPAAPAEGQPIGFISLRKGNVEVMLQSRASVANDVAALAKGEFSCTGIGLFIQVDDLAPILDASKGCEVVIPERTTFYGMREIGLRAPGGCVVLFAQQVGAPS